MFDDWAKVYICHSATVLILTLQKTHLQEIHLEIKEGVEPVPSTKSALLDFAQTWAPLCLHLSWPAAVWPKVSNVPLIKRNIPYPGIDFQIHLLLISLWFNLIKSGSISNIDFNKILIKIRAIIKHNFSDHCCISMDPTSKTNLLLEWRRGFSVRVPWAIFRNKEVTSWSFLLAKISSEIWPGLIQSLISLPT